MTDPNPAEAVKKEVSLPTIGTNEKIIKTRTPNVRAQTVLPRSPSFLRINDPTKYINTVRERYKTSIYKIWLEKELT